MSTRRVVTANDSSGKSIFVSDAVSPREVVHQHTPGFVSSPIWLHQGVPDLTKPNDDPMEKGGSLIPAIGGSNFLVVTFPPDSVMMSPDFNPDLAGPEQLEAVPGIAETFEMENPGMHVTPTVDFAIVVSGNIVLELDDGNTVALGHGDTVVQQGTRHAWRNPGSEPATIAFVMISAVTK